MSSTLRRGLAFFPPEAIQPILQQLMERMAGCFDETGFACYLWIVGKVAGKFGGAATGPGGEGMAGLLGGAFEKVTQVLARRLGEKTAVEMPDGESFSPWVLDIISAIFTLVFLNRSLGGFTACLHTVTTSLGLIPLFPLILPSPNADLQCWTTTPTS